MLIDACGYAARFLLLPEVAVDGELASSEPNSHGGRQVVLFGSSRGYSIPGLTCTKGSKLPKLTKIFPVYPNTIRLLFLGT